MNKEEKIDQYTKLILAAIERVVNDDLGSDEFKEEENFTLFLHSLSNVASTTVHNIVTGKNLTLLEYNHIMNILCFQYSYTNDCGCEDENCEVDNSERSFTENDLSKIQSRVSHVLRKDKPEDHFPEIMGIFNKELGVAVN